jgi:hypothetical protein
LVVTFLQISPDAGGNFSLRISGLPGKKTYEGALSPYSFVAIKEEKMKIVQAFTSKRLLLI